MTFTAWRQPMTIQEINTDIDNRWPTLIGFNLREQLVALENGCMWFTAFAPKWEITQMCLRAGLIAFGSDNRNVYLTSEGRGAIQS